MRLSENPELNLFPKKWIAVQNKLDSTSSKQNLREKQKHIFCKIKSEILSMSIDVLKNWIAVPTS